MGRLQLEPDVMGDRGDRVHVDCSTGILALGYRALHGLKGLVSIEADSQVDDRQRLIYLGVKVM